MGESALRADLNSTINHLKNDVGRDTALQLTKDSNCEPQERVE